MSQSRLAGSYLAVMTVSLLSAWAARAGIWGSQPDIGISADYNSNPALRHDSAERAQVEAAGWRIGHDGMRIDTAEARS